MSRLRRYRTDRAMKPFTLQEFAENLRVSGNWREADFADEILALIDIEADIAEPYSNLIVDLEIYAPTELNGKPEKAMEWLGDRSNMLTEIEELLIERGWNGEGDFLDAVRDMTSPIDRMEYDL